jgi:hypothetical protein
LFAHERQQKRRDYLMGLLIGKLLVMAIATFVLTSAGVLLARQIAPNVELKTNRPAYLLVVLGCMAAIIGAMALALIALARLGYHF